MKTWIYFLIRRVGQTKVFDFLFPHVFVHKAGTAWSAVPYEPGYESDCGYNAVRKYSDWNPLVYIPEYEKTEDRAKKRWGYTSPKV